MFLLLDSILPIHLEKIKADKQGYRRKMNEYDWADLDEALLSLLKLFHNRMQDLIRSWKAHGLDIPRQIHSFGGGVLTGWYTAVRIAFIMEHIETDMN